MTDTPSARFADYATSGAFAIGLTRGQIATLALIAGARPQRRLRRWLKTARLSGRTTRSTRGSGARRSALAATTAMPRSGMRAGCNSRSAAIAAYSGARIVPAPDFLGVACPMILLPPRMYDRMAEIIPKTDGRGGE